MSDPGPRRRAIVVGGGPAGLIAAEELARSGLGVTVYEHKRSVGRKLLLAGRGGLNITHSEPEDRFLARYGAGTSAIAGALAAFSAADLRAWCASLGEETFVGSSGRVFPASFKATPLLRAWLGRLDALGVGFRLQHRWVDLDAGTTDPIGVRFIGPDGPVDAVADVVVLALGGASWPRVGADGGWVPALEQLGVEVTTLEAANCGVRVTWTPTFVERFAGHPVKNVVLAAGETTTRGDCVITDDGLEGGPVYGLGPAIRRELTGDGAVMTIDLRPDVPTADLAVRLGSRRPKESTARWLRRAGFRPVEAGLLREATANTLPDAAVTIASLAKRLPIAVAGLAPIERAISTAGGIALTEIDDSFMLRRRPGVFVAGEMLDWEAPTGGYLLQGCLSTGTVAGRGAAAWAGSGR